MKFVVTYVAAFALICPLIYGQQETKLLPSDGTAGDVFGWSVAISGETAIIGAFQDDDSGPSAGSAYLFDSSSGSRLTKLLPGTGASASGDQFGKSVAISGGMAIVGASSAENGVGVQSGSAYIFDVTNGTQVAHLFPSDGASNDQFGSSVALDGATAVVGSQFDDDNGSGSGAAYIFDIMSGVQIAKLLPSDGQADDYFGYSVSIGDGFVVVGAPNKDEGFVQAGAAYIFDVNTGSQLFKLLPGDGDFNDNFGCSVSISGDTVIVGSRLDSDNGLHSGSAYLFNAVTGAQTAKLFPSNGAFSDYFGTSVFIDGTRAIVGAPGQANAAHPTGSVYIFDLAAGTEIANLLASDGSPEDRFGWSVAISGSKVITGGHLNDDNGMNSGSAYLYDLPSTSFGPQQVITNSTGQVYSVYAADFDLDGDMDVLSGHNDTIAWWENQGGGSFGSQQVITTSTDTARVYATDLDGDGDPDILSASLGYDRIEWYENLGGGSFGSQQVITDLADGAFSVFASDLDGDGDPDVLSASAYDHKVAWYENLGSGNFGPQQVISTNVSYPRSVYATDLDQDGDPDVLSASNGDGKIAWYENLGGGLFGEQQIVSTNANGTYCVYATDLDGDGDADVLSACGSNNTVQWYENLGGGSFGPEQVITTEAEDVDSIYATDLDGDGDADVLSASPDDAKIAWYENQGDGSFGSQQVIDDTGNVNNKYSVYAADLNGNGKTDVLAASYNEYEVAWYENLMTPPDCNGNGVADLQDIATGTSSDCDNDHVPDECQIAAGQETDCDNDGEIDACQHTEDCDLNGTLDVCDIATGAASDINGNGIIDSCECLASSYCIASPNSVSATGAQISLDGLPNLSGNSMALRADNLRPNQFGVFFYGPIQQDPPVSFGDGYRCVATFALTRLNPPVPTGTGTAQRPLDMTVSPLSNVQAGDTRYFQFWYRDPGVIGAGYNLTDALSVTFCP